MKRVLTNMWRLCKFKVKVPYKSQTHATYKPNIENRNTYVHKYTKFFFYKLNWKFVNEAERCGNPKQKY